MKCERCNLDLPVFNDPPGRFFILLCDECELDRGGYPNEELDEHVSEEK